MTRLVVVDTKLVFELKDGEEPDHIFDTANMMLIPQQVINGGEYRLIDYAFGDAKVASVPLEQYNYDDGLPDEDMQ